MHERESQKNIPSVVIAPELGAAAPPEPEPVAAISPVGRTSERTTTPPTRPRLAKPPVPKGKKSGAVRAEHDDHDGLAASQAADAMHDDRVPGVPRQVSRSAKTTVAVVVALAVVLVVAGGLRAMQAHQDQLADEARSRPAETATVEAPTPPRWPAVTPTASVPVGSTAALTAPPATTDLPASSSPAPRVPSPSSLIAPGAVATGPRGETAILGRDPSGLSLVSQADRALVRGATARALVLARQAVTANPDDADAWLTLGAACQSSGDVAGARDAYRNCVARAHTANISECRLLLRP